MKQQHKARIVHPTGNTGFIVLGTGISRKYAIRRAKSQCPAGWIVIEVISEPVEAK